MNELVICDPNVLFKSIYQLVAVSFAGKGDFHTSAPYVRKTGEIPGELVKHICAQHSESPLKNQHIVDLLKHFKILTELRSGDATVFFMPCLLQPGNSCLLSREQLECFCIPPLLVRFDGNYIPIGVFSALVVKLSQTSWKPDRKSRYRNHILFRTDLFSVKLIVYPAYLEFRISIANKKEPKEPLHQFCMETREIVVGTLKAVLDLHEHTRKTKFQLGFYCPGSFQASGSDDPHFCECFPSWNHTNPKTFACSKCPRYQEQDYLPHRTTIWFDYWKDEKETGEDSGNDTTLRTANKKPYFGAPSPERPKTISELDQDQPQSFQYENVDDTSLGEDDLSDIIRELTDVVAGWRNIGTLLGIRDGQLQTIQLQANSPLGCLREMLVTWLRRNYDVKRFGEPTWVKLVEVVNDPTGGGNPFLATEIARKHGDQRVGERSKYPTHPPPKGEFHHIQTSPHKNVKDTLLGEDDLLDVTDYLQNIDKTHIYNLGLVLGLRQTKVRAMKDSDTFLDDVITAWLRREDKVTEKGEPSWTVLANALKHHRVGQTGIANDIAKGKGLVL